MNNENDSAVYTINSVLEPLDKDSRDIVFQKVLEKYDQINIEPVPYWGAGRITGIISVIALSAIITIGGLISIYDYAEFSFATPIHITVIERKPDPVPIPSIQIHVSYNSLTNGMSKLAIKHDGKEE